MQRPKTLLAIALLMCLPSATGIKAKESANGSTASDVIDLAGEWHSSQFGRQTLSLRPDGSADLTMQLSTMAAVLYGKNVTLHLEWQLEGNLLTQHVVGGSPERSVEKLTQRFGTTYVYRVLEMESGQLTVEDTTTGKTCAWNSLNSDTSTN